LQVQLGPLLTKLPFGHVLLLCKSLSCEYFSTLLGELDLIGEIDTFFMLSTVGVDAASVVFCSEAFPNRLRAKGVALAIATIALSRLVLSAGGRYSLYEYWVEVFLGGVTYDVL
jgi:hypothetical protein